MYWRIAPPSIVLACMLAPSVPCCQGAEPAEAEVVAQMQPYAGPSVEGVDRSTLVGKVMCGYQGWFAAEGDGSGRGWFHYWRGGEFKPGQCSIDLWPDLSELDEDEKYATAFRHADGSTACVFSSMNRKTVLRHFRWMEEHGIDGAMVQRFTPRPGDAKHLHHVNTVLAHCREGANRHGRAYAVMYDMHFDEPAIRHMRRDWERLIDRMQITRDPAYLHHRGKPVLVLWGIGFTHRRWDAEAVKGLLDFLQNDPRYGGLTVVLGVPAYWRTLSDDCRDDAAIHEVLLQADVICPWSVGRFGLVEDVAHHADFRLKPDLAWCREHEKDYLPVVFPGFSWHNMHPEQPLGQTPRLKGHFLWRQFVEAQRAGATMAYVAMFDEMDEGTAVFKCTNDPPVGQSRFLDYEDLPSDHYLWLVGMGGRLLRGETEPAEILPKRGCREIIQTVRVHAAGVVSPWGELAVRELREYFQRMFINPIEPAEDGDRLDVIVGTPQGNPLVREAIDRGLLALPQGNNADQGYAVRTIDDTIYLVAATERGLCYGVYGLLEAYGAYFLISGEHLPAKREFSPKPLEVCVAPVFKYRGILPWDNFICGMSGYDREHYRQLISRAARMKLNMLQFHFYPGFALYTETWDGKPVDPGWIAQPVNCFRPQGAIGEAAFGGMECFGPQAWIENRGDPRAQAEACQEVFRGALKYARQRGMATAVGFALMTPTGGDPTYTDKPDGANTINPLDPHNVDLSVQRYRTLVDLYPESDYYWMWQSEAGGSIHRQVGREPGAAEMREKYAHWCGRPGVEGDVDYAWLFREVANCLTPEERARLATGGWDIQHLFPGIDPEFPKEVIFASLNAAYPDFAVNEVPRYQVARNGRRAWMIDWWEFDGNQWFPQFRVGWQEKMYRQCADFGVEGVTLLGWKLSAVEHNVRYLADFAWQPELGAEEFYRTYTARLYGEAAGPALDRLYREYDEMEIKTPPATPSDFRPMLLGAGWRALAVAAIPETPEAFAAAPWKTDTQRAAEILPWQQKLLETDRRWIAALGDLLLKQRGKQQKWTRLLLNRLEFRVLYVRSMQSLNQALLTLDEVYQQRGLTEARAAAAQRAAECVDLARQAIEKYAAEVRNRGDQGVIVQLNEQYYKPLKQFHEALSE